MTQDNGGAQPDVIVAGSGWTAGETVGLYLDSEFGSTWLEQAIADPSGDVSFGQGSVPLPSWLVTYSENNASNCAGAGYNKHPGCAYELTAMGSSGLAQMEEAAGSFNLDTSNAGQPAITFPNGRFSETFTGNINSSACRATATAPAGTLTPQLPLHVTSRWILDAHGDRFKLASVNWYGAEEADFVPSGLECQPVKVIADRLLQLGVNSVRLPWSNAMEELDPVSCTHTTPDPSPGSAWQAGEECVPPQALAANPKLIGDTALQVFAKVIAALAADGIAVILDDHSTDAAFSYSPYDGLWWSGKIWDDRYGLGSKYQARTLRWERDWVSLLTTLKSNLGASAYNDVIGADLRNEPSQVPPYGISAQWPTGTQPPGGPGSNCLSPFSPQSSDVNWVAAAEEGGDAVLCADPSLLIMVEGVNYSLCFNGDANSNGSPFCMENTSIAPVVLDTPSKVVYSPHAYPFDFKVNGLTYSQGTRSFTAALGANWGFFLTQGKPYTAPVWVGEFGATAALIPQYSTVTPTTSCDGTDEGAWFNCFVNYLESNDADWSYWAVNGTEADEGIAEETKTPRTLLTGELYGILDSGWARQAGSGLTADLQRIEIPAQGPGSWTPIEAPLPANAAPAGLNAVSCPAAGSCTAVGYNNPGGSEQGLIETLSGHTWTPAEAPVPANASSSPDTYLSSVTCPAAGSCTAAGLYTDSGNGVDPLVEMLSGATWTPSELPQPGNAAATPSAGLFAVDCPFGSCTAVGYYFDSSATMQGLIETSSGGTWTAAQAPLPADAGSNPHFSLTSVACPGLGSCVAVGNYLDNTGGIQAVIETLSGGTWTAAQAPLPANAGSGQGGDLQSVTCLAADSCTAVGGYFDTSGNSAGMIDTLSGGTWTAVQASVPAGAGTNPLISLSSITCLAAGSCTAVGGYDDSSGDGQGMIDTLSGGTWTAAEAALVANSVSSPYSFLSSVTCPAAGSCTAVGTYVDALGDEGLIDRQNPPRP